MTYVNKSDRFTLNQWISDGPDEMVTPDTIDRLCHRQYWTLYQSRLKKLRPMLEANVARTWGDVPLVEMAETPASGECVLIGVIQNISHSKPSVLASIAQEHHFLAPQKVFLAEPVNILQLLDGNQKTTLVNVNSDNYLTGSVCALRGSLNKNTSSKDSCFHVKDCMFPCPQSWSTVPLPQRQPVSDTYIAFIAGLNISDDSELSTEHLMLVHLIAGNEEATPGKETLSDIFRNSVCRVIVVGSCFKEEEIQAKKNDYLASLLQEGTNSISAESVNWLDFLLAQLSASKAVDVQPGRMDPTDSLLPRQPLDLSLFPLLGKQATRANVRFTTSPYDFALGDIRVVGTCGSVISDIKRSSQCENALDIMELLLQMGHLFPTAPETLGCFPINQGDDCFAMTVLPDVIYVNDEDIEKPECRWFKHPLDRCRPDGGNVECETEEKLEGTTLMLALPSFSKSKTISLLNLKDFTLKYVEIGAK